MRPPRSCDNPPRWPTGDPLAPATFDRDRRRAGGPSPPRSGRARPRRVAWPSTRPIQRSRGIPLAGRLLLGLAVIAVAVGVLYVGARGLGTVATSVGGVVTGFIEGVTATPVPSATPVVAPRSPSIVVAQRAVHQPGDGRPGRHRPRCGRRRPGLPDPCLPRARGPGTDADPGVAAGRDAADDHPGGADPGHQRLHGHPRRAFRRVRTIAAGPLCPRPEQAADQAGFAARRRDGQPQGRRPGGPDPGPLDDHGAQRGHERLDRRHGRQRRRVLAPAATRVGRQPHRHHLDRPGRQRQRTGVDGQSGIGRAACCPERRCVSLQAGLAAGGDHA